MPLLNMQQDQDMNLVLSSDAKPRLKWNPELHQRFVHAVAQLGGADSKYIHKLCTPLDSFYVIIISSV